MFEVEPIVVDHKDVIHDVVFDYYGRRMATCSSDQTVKVSDQRLLNIRNVPIWRLSYPLATDMG